MPMYGYWGGCEVVFHRNLESVALSAADLVRLELLIHHYNGTLKAVWCTVFHFQKYVVRDNLSACGCYQQ